MQVRKRNGATEPVDVNKIVRAVERWADDLTDVDPMRVATKHDQRPLRRRDHRRARPAVHPDRGRADRRGAAVLAARRPAADRHIDEEARGQGVASFCLDRGSATARG